MYGAVVADDGSGYMFTAPSGTGKSIHVALWKKYFENAEIINGDKPFIRVDESGVWVYGHVMGRERKLAEECGIKGDMSPWTW